MPLNIFLFLSGIMVLKLRCKKEWTIVPTAKIFCVEIQIGYNRDLYKNYSLHQTKY